MALTINSEIRDVHGITPEQEAKILDFLQGAVYCWCNNQDDTGNWFSMRDLMGRDNYYWQGTPLIVLYWKHIAKGKDDESAVKGAGIDSGWLLKKVIDKDKRTFETEDGVLIRKYRWIKRDEDEYTTPHQVGE
jgi:hypothetical protein